MVPRTGPWERPAISGFEEPKLEGVTQENYLRWSIPSASWYLTIVRSLSCTLQISTPSCGLHLRNERAVYRSYPVVESIGVSEGLGEVGCRKLDGYPLHPG
jgi:hypothetical protein